MSRHKKDKRDKRDPGSLGRQFELTRRHISGGAVRLSDMKDVMAGHESRQTVNGVARFVPRDPRRKPF